MSYPAVCVAYEFIRVAQDRGKPMHSLTKLIKLAFLAHGYSLAILDRPLVKEDFEAWPYGPVVPELYFQFKRQPRPFQPADDESSQAIDPKDKELIEATHKWDGHKNYRELSRQAHQLGSPWYEAWEREEDSKISDDSIKEYYSSLLELGE